MPAPSTASPSSDPSLMVSGVGATWTWHYAPGFAPWLRELRVTHRLTLRAAAERLGITFTRLQKLETGGRVRAPSLALIGRIAELYGREPDQVLARAGFRMVVGSDLRDAARCDEVFAALVLHPTLRPACMDERWLEAFSRIQKAQWVEFARRLDAHARSGGAPLAEILGETPGQGRGAA